MMNEVSPLFGINQQFDYKWDEQVQVFLNQYGNREEFIIQFIDGLVPIYHTDIWDVAWAYNLGNVALGIEHATGHTVFELFQHEIAKIYHDEFAEAYYRYTQEEE